MANAPNTSSYLVAQLDTADLPNNRLLYADPFGSQLQFSDSGSGGNFTLAPTLTLASITQLNTAGLLSYDNNHNVIPRTITSASTIQVSNGNGLGGNPTLEVISDTSKQKIAVSANGASAPGARSNLNFIAGPNVTIAVADDGADNRLNVTFSAATGMDANASVLLASSVDGHAFNLGSLGSGLLKLSVAGGVATPSIAVSGTDYIIPTAGLNELAALTPGVGNIIVSNASAWSSLAAGSVGQLLAITSGGQVGWVTSSASGAPANSTYLCQTSSNLPNFGVNLGASGAKLGIGTTIPAFPVDVVTQTTPNGNFYVGLNQTAQGLDSRAVITTYQGGSYLSLRSAQGTIGAQAPTSINNVLGGVVATGAISSTAFAPSGSTREFTGGLIWTAAENFSASNNGTGATLYTTPTGTSTPVIAISYLPSGSADFKFKSTFEAGFDGTGGTFHITNAATAFNVDSPFNVTGATTVAALTASGLVTLNGGLSFSGNIGGTPNFTGTPTFAAGYSVNAGSITIASGVTTTNNGSVLFNNGFQVNSGNTQFYTGAGNTQLITFDPNSATGTQTVQFVNASAGTQGVNFGDGTHLTAVQIKAASTFTTASGATSTFNGNVFFNNGFQVNSTNTQFFAGAGNTQTITFDPNGSTATQNVQFVNTLGGTQNVNIGDGTHATTLQIKASSTILFSPSSTISGTPNFQSGAVINSGTLQMSTGTAFTVQGGATATFNGNVTFDPNSNVTPQTVSFTNVNGGTQSINFGDGTNVTAVQLKASSTFTAAANSTVTSNGATFFNNGFQINSGNTQIYAGAGNTQIISFDPHSSTATQTIQFVNSLVGVQNVNFGDGTHLTAVQLKANATFTAAANSTVTSNGATFFNNGFQINSGSTQIYAGTGNTQIISFDPNSATATQTVQFVNALGGTQSVNFGDGTHLTAVQLKAASTFTAAASSTCTFSGNTFYNNGFQVNSGGTQIYAGAGNTQVITFDPHASTANQTVQFVNTAVGVQNVVIGDGTNLTTLRVKNNSQFIIEASTTAGTNGNFQALQFSATDSVGGTSRGYFRGGTTQPFLFINGTATGVPSGGYDLELYSDSATKPGAGGLWHITSDARIKANIQDISNAMSLINQLRPVKYNFTDAYCEAKSIDKDFSEYGFIADEVEKVLPECVQVTSASIPGVENLKSLNMGPASALVFKCLQELSAQITALQAQVTALAPASASQPSTNGVA